MSLSDLFDSKINQAIQSHLREANLDPLKTVVKGSQALGSLDLGVCTATTTAGYSVTDLTGLSSLTITPALDLDLSQLGNLLNNKKAALVGTLTVSGAFASSLSAKLHGDLDAACGELEHDFKFEGTASASGLSASAKGDVTIEATPTGFLQPVTVCITAITLDSLTFELPTVDVEIEDLGVFNDLMNQLIEVIRSHIVTAFQTGVNELLKNALNELIKSELPFCEDVGAADVLKLLGNG